jgi:hypothetical protein
MRVSTRNRILRRMEKCWICGAEAGSGEHLIKASDLRSRFGRVSPDEPLYMHTKERRNVRINGLKSSKLLSTAPMCHTCNSTGTQPYDLAWEMLSEHLAARHALRSGEKINLHRFFPGKVKASMRDVQLFFVKLLGCKCVESAVPVDVQSFARALRERKAHPHIRIGFCPPFSRGLVARRSPQVLGSSEVEVLEGTITKRVHFASWFYYLDFVSVRVIYAESELWKPFLRDHWHPDSVGKLQRVARHMITRK